MIMFPHAGAVYPHDLLRITTVEALVGDGPPPGWAAATLADAPWVVVRRAQAPAGWIPVGVRGSFRHERWAALLPIAAVLERWPPEAVASRIGTLSPQRRTDIPALAAVPRLAMALARLNLRGGPTGSIGFELVSGRATATGTSDLDAVVRAETRLSPTLAVELVAEIAQLSVRCDLLLETPNGAVALAEYARGAVPVALRGLQGPRLVTDPWAVSIE